MARAVCQRSRRDVFWLGPEQQLSAHVGTAPSWAWLHGKRWGELLAGALPHRLPKSNNNLKPLEKALAFVPALLGEARKLTHVAYFRRDPLVPELLCIRRVPSQSTLSRFFAGFRSAGANLACFRPLWRWGLERLPSRRDGYAKFPASQTTARCEVC